VYVREGERSESASFRSPWTSKNLSKKNLKIQNTLKDNHRVPQAGHDGRAASQHALGPGVHPRPPGKKEEEVEEARGKKREEYFFFNFLPLMKNKTKTEKNSKGLEQL
jgi:hypothetical protein